MNPRKYALLVLAALAIAFVGPASRADVEHCRIISAGAETTLPASYHNIGQGIIGRSSNASTSAHHGGLACLRVHTTCLLGDVNGDGIIDGLDVAPFTEVTLTGFGTPRELCAANLSIDDFAELLVTLP
jgi:hypothetical protein